jgi:hypothetical protein
MVSVPIACFGRIRRIPVSSSRNLGGEDGIYSARIGLEFRALAVMKKDRVVSRQAAASGERPTS